MTIEQTLIAMQNAKTNVRITFDGGYTYSGEDQWNVSISKNSNEVSCSVTIKHEMVTEAIREAWDKYQKSIKRGMPELQAAIEHRIED